MGDGYTGLAITAAGVLIFLTALIATQTGKMKGDSITNITLNMVGSVFTTMGAAYDSSWGFVTLEVLWFLVSFVSFARYFYTFYTKRADNMSCAVQLESVNLDLAEKTAKPDPDKYLNELGNSI
jgi:hypothetical protein